MILYAVTAVLCIFLWKMLGWSLSYVHTRRAISKSLSHFPLPEEHHWFFGIAHLVKDYDSYLSLFQKNVEKSRPKAMAVWLTWLENAIFVCHPDTIKDILKASHTVAIKGSAYRLLHPMIGEGLVTSDGKKWERNRRLLTPAFHFDVLKPYVKVYNEVADVLIRKITNLGEDGKSLDVCPVISRATLDTVLRCALSYVDTGIQSTDRNPHPYCNAVNKLKDILLLRFMNPLLHNDFIFGFKSESKEMKRLCDYLHNYSDSFIKLRREALADDPSQLKKRHLDFLDILLTARDENGQGMSDKEIRAEVDTFVFAGHDTTASAIMWSLYHLAKYPKMQQNVRDEVQSICLDNQAMEFDDISRLEYTSRFIKESLRMIPPVPGHDRVLAEPVTIDGVTFPAKTGVQVSSWCLHHNPAVWENHNEFDPDRFLPERMSKMDAFAFVPFSAGQRNCIGQHFALNEIKVLISRLVSRFEISLDKNKEAVPFRDLTTSAKNGIYLHFQALEQTTRIY